WAIGVSHSCAYWAVAGVCSLTFGVLMVLRQSSAAPLSRLGLVGAPPTPPSKSEVPKRQDEDDLLLRLSSN
ncbi:phosphoesterase, partial [Gardnerella vaginalis]